MQKTKKQTKIYHKSLIPEQRKTSIVDTTLVPFIAWRLFQGQFKRGLQSDLDGGERDRNSGILRICMAKQQKKCCTV